MFNRLMTHRVFRKIHHTLVRIGLAAFIISCLAGVSSAATIKAVPSALMVGYDETLAIDIVVEGIPAQGPGTVGLGTVQFRLNVSAPGATISNVSDLSQAKAGEISFVTPLIVGPITSTRSGIGDFFWNARSTNGILVMDNESLQNGTAMFTLSHTNGAALPSGNGTIARFLVKAGTGVPTDHISITLSDVALLNGDVAYPIDSTTGTDVQVRCKTKMPSLFGLSYSDAMSALTVAQLTAGTVYEIDNNSGSLPLKVVLEQSLTAGSDQFCGTTVNLAINTPPAIQVTNITEGALLTTAVTPAISITDTNLQGSIITLNSQPYTQGTQIIKNGSYTLAIVANDMLGNTASLTLHFAINKNVPPIALNTLVLSPATIGTSYTASLVVTGGTAPYSWVIASGSLPAGVSLNSATGGITGVPTVVGMYPVTVQVTDLDQAGSAKTFVMSVNDITAQWMKTSGGTAQAVATGTAVDEAGNLYVTGYTSNATDHDCLTIKYDQAGNVLWTKSYDSGSDDYASGVTVDEAGNVYVTGYSGNGTLNGYLTIKYDPAGNELWTRKYDNGYDYRAAAVAVDGTGNVYVTGSACTVSGCNIITVEYDADGALVWTQNYDRGYDDYAQGIAIDAAGNVTVVGSSSNGTNMDYVTFRFDPSGALVWTKSYDSGTNDYAAGVAVDAMGDVYVAGYSDTGTAKTYLTIKYDPTGVLLWARTYDSGFNDIAAGVALDSEGNAYVVGSSSLGNNSDYQIVKHDPAGNIIWTQRYDSGTNDYAAGIAIDAINSVYVTGYTRNTELKEDYLTIKYQKVGQGMAISTKTLPTAALGTAYTKTLIALGGTMPYTWSIASGSLPIGMSLNAATGEISGTAAANANATFTVRVTDATGATVEKAYTLIAHDAPIITTGTLAPGVTGIAYSQTITASGGSGSYTWSVFSGALPVGLSLVQNGIAGQISGTPSQIGNYTFTVRVTDSDGLIATKQYTVAVSSLTIITNQIASGITGFAYRQTLAAAGGTTPYTWSISPGSLPTGLALDTTTGVISGIPAASGTYGLTIQVADANAASSTKDMSITIHDPIGAYQHGGSYIASQKVIFKPLEGVMVYCTTDGTNPLIALSHICAGPIVISHSLTLKFFAADAAGNKGDLKTETYVITGGGMSTWGNNASGQLGDGTSGTNRLVPVQVNGLTGVVATAGGGSHTVALRNDGTVWAWGNNYSGQLGDGTSGTSKLTPIEVNGLSGVLAVAAGTSHSAALRNDGTVWAWGNNDSGQLGDGTSGTNRLTPSQVNGLTGVADIAAGASHSIAIKKDGTVWTWGNNDSGQIGDGSLGTNRLAPVQVGGLTGIVAIDAGTSHTIALKNDGTVWAWGNNDFGQLGDNTSGTSIATPVQVSGLTGAAAVASGASHTVALKNDGTVWTWGNNASGQLGDGASGIDRPTPVQVNGLTGVAAIAAGASHTTSLKNDGTVWAWGNNTSGQLGDGTSGTNRLTPVQVSGLLSGAALAGGDNHVLTITPSPLTIETAALPYGTIASLYNQSIIVSGGLAPYTWSVASGNLPDGLTLDGAIGTLSGTPTTAGTYIFTVQVTDKAFNSATKQFSLTVYETLAITTSSPLPSGAACASYNQTLAATGGLTPYTWSVIGGSLPGGLTLDVTTGVISGTPNATGAFTFTVQVKDKNGATASKQLSLTTSDPLAIPEQSLPSGIVGTPYSATLAVSGCFPPYTWAVASGSLPPGLTLNSSTGAISGTPTTTGTFCFTVQVADSISMTATKQLCIAINDRPIIIPPTLPDGMLGTPYSQTLTATGGKTPYAWSIASGSLPNGLSLTGSTGVISGSPTAAGTFTFTLQVMDANSITNTKALSITIWPQLIITTSSLPSGKVGTAYSQTLVATGGKTPYTWSIASGSLPTGLTLNSSTGEIAGTPIAAGTFNFTVQVMDANSFVTTKPLSITIADALVITTSTLPFGIVGTPYSQTLSAIGGTKPYAWSISTGKLPTGLTLNITTGVISGTPTAAATYSFTVKVTDAKALTATKALSIIIYSPLSISTSALSFGTVGKAYSQTLAATGGKTPYAWSISAGSLPTGLSLNSSTGVISGTPTVSGTYGFTVQVMDANSTKATKALSIAIYDPLSITTTSLPNGKLSTAYSQTLAATGGKTPYTWSIASGSLPTGLTLNSTTGVISGKPTRTGTYSFTAQVKDANATTATKALSIIVQ